MWAVTTGKCVWGERLSREPVGRGGEQNLKGGVWQLKAKVQGEDRTECPDILSVGAQATVRVPGVEL